jgi:hypothetical protein
LERRAEVVRPSIADGVPPKDAQVIVVATVKTLDQRPHDDPAITRAQRLLKWVHGPPDRSRVLARQALRNGELPAGKFADLVEISRREATTYTEAEEYALGEVELIEPTECSHSEGEAGY